MVSTYRKKIFDMIFFIDISYFGDDIDDNISICKRLLISLGEKYLFLEKKYIIEKKVSFLEKNILY